MPAAPLDHLRQKQVADTHRCKQIDLQHLLPTIGWHVVESTAHPDTGIINKYVGTAVKRLNIIEKLAAAVIVNKICGNTAKNLAGVRLIFRGQRIE